MAIKSFCEELCRVKNSPGWRGVGISAILGSADSHSIVPCKFVNRNLEIRKHRFFKSPVFFQNSNLPGPLTQGLK